MKEIMKEISMYVYADQRQAERAFCVCVENAMKEKAANSRMCV